MPSASECSLPDLFVHARAGALDECNGCPRNPHQLGNDQKVGLDCVFALGCGFHQRMDAGGVRVLFLMQDPSSSPQIKSQVGCEDGHVCPWCNTDPSAANLKELINQHLAECLPMDGHQRWPVFFSNAVLHGPLVMEPNGPRPKALNSCALVNRRLIELLKPQMVVALGTKARDTLIQEIFKLKPDQEEAYLLGEHPVPVSDSLHLFWSYHPSPINYNQEGRRTQIHNSFGVIQRHLEETPGVPYGEALTLLRGFLESHTEPVPEWLLNLSASASSATVIRSFLSSRVIFNPMADNEFSEVLTFGCSGSAHCFVRMNDATSIEDMPDKLLVGGAAYRIAQKMVLGREWIQSLTHGIQQNQPENLNADDPSVAPYAILALLERESFAQAGPERLAVLFLNLDPLKAFQSLFARPEQQVPYAITFPTSTFSEFGLGSELENLARNMGSMPEWLLAEDTRPGGGAKKVTPPRDSPLPGLPFDHRGTAWEGYGPVPDQPVVNGLKLYHRLA